MIAKPESGPSQTAASAAQKAERIVAIARIRGRKCRAPGYEDIRHYEWIVAALAETTRVMGDIDEEIEKAGGFPLR